MTHLSIVLSSQLTAPIRSVCAIYAEARESLEQGANK